MSTMLSFSSWRIIMLKKVLIANRGEIALSIFRACRELGIKTVSIYSSADKDQPIVYLTDESYCIGNSASTDSYLNKESILLLAKTVGCDGIHPGYGFLSENPDFARQVEECGIKLVGPSADTMKLMGDKLSARTLMEKIGVPLVPGSKEAVKNKDELMKIAEDIGYPLLLKPSAGGGGKGMRRIYREEELADSFHMAKYEAKMAFGDDRIYVEKLIENPRHIEIQILADSEGNVIHLNERECSLQRRNQKIIEESPCNFLDDKVLREMGQCAVKCAKACNYEGAGTIEFVVDHKGNFYFIEMNTRIQVEYPVTEMITGINLIKEQLKIASGISLKWKQEDIKREGHAIEVRINAQNPLENFAPDCGKIDFYMPPGGYNTRFETFIYQGIEILPFYDSMIGKLIVKGDDRLDAIKKMRRAVEETVIGGIKTNLGFQYAILHETDFLQGKIDTGYIDKHEEKLLKEMKLVQEASKHDGFET